MSNYELNICWNRNSLQSDLAAIQHELWTPHYNEVYRGDWSGMALRSATGSATQLAGHEKDAEDFLDTVLLDRTPYFREVLSFFQCHLKSVRLLKLGPQSTIHEHCDPTLGSNSGEVRIHIPLQTNPAVEFYLDGDRFLLEEGQTYTLDVSRPHRVKNPSEKARIHLVIDAVLNPWLCGILERGRAIRPIAPPPQSFSAFRHFVISSPELQQRLRAETRKPEFAKLVVKTGLELGFDFDDADVEWRSVPTLDSAAANPAEGWAPVAVDYSKHVPVAEWLAIGPRGFRDSFYEETIRSARREPFAQAFRWKQPLELQAPRRNPTGFIFHMSRCGSTLLAQMLAALDRATVISEAPPLDDVMSAILRMPDLNPEKHAAALRSLVWALAPSHPEKELFFIKLDAWHVHQLPLIRLAFPEVPWLFLYRAPLEVLVSQTRSPAQFALPGGMTPSILGLNVEDVVGLTREEWCAHALANFCRSALRFADDRGLFVNYRDLPQALWERLATHFSISFSTDEVETMRSAAAFDAKRPRQQFLPDSGQKRDEATPSLKALAAEVVDSLYLELESHPQAALSNKRFIAAD